MKQLTKVATSNLLNNVKEVGKMKKINKTKARKEFNNGKEIILFPCKANIYSIWWNGGYRINNNNEKDFDSIVNNYEYYNCNSENGYYSSYYINDERK